MAEPTTLGASGEMNQWVIDLKAELNKLGKTQSQEERSRKKRSIYKLPPLISKLNENAYQPQLVSFGPYHHGKPHLKPMEDHKQRAVLHFLRRSPLSLDTILDSMVKEAVELKESYDSLEPDWKDDTEKFAKLMIVDGCFLLEILRAATQRYWRFYEDTPTVDDLIFDEQQSGSDGATLDSGSDYSMNDPIFGDGGSNIMHSIARDMLLLENQLPMLVLFKLIGIEGNDKKRMEALNKWIVLFLSGFPYKVSNLETGKSLHILDLYRKSLLAKQSKPVKSNCALIPGERLQNNLSATELKDFGICFKMSKSDRPMDISFDFERGILRLPEFIVDDITESTYLNLMAFERCHIKAGYDITSYIYFMDNIICHDRDVKLLSSKGIIFNDFGTDKAVADLFHKMSKDLMIDPSDDLNGVTRKITDYKGKSWRKWRAELLHTYFKNPWAFVSVAAASILFILTTLQTGFTMYDVIHK